MEGCEENLREEKEVSSVAWRMHGTLASLTLCERERQTTWTFVGQCVSGLRSCVLIPELGLAFDFGFAFEQAMNQASTVCVTHGHVDHIGSLHFIAFERKMHRLEPPTFVMPRALKRTFEEAYRAYSCLNHHPAMNEVEQSTSKRYTLLSAPIWNNKNDNDNNDDSHNKHDTGVNLQKGKGTYFVRAFPVVHGVPSVGYCVFMRSNKLITKYVGLEGKEIGRLRRSGVQVSETVETPIIAYTGDTIIEGVIRHEEWLSARILFMECTYIDVVVRKDDVSSNIQTSEKDKEACSLIVEEGLDTPKEAKRRRHIHEQHIAHNAERFCDIQHLVLCHFSRRYTSLQIRAAIVRLQLVFDTVASKIGKQAPQVHAFI